MVVELGAAERHRFVEHRQCIAHTAISLLRSEVERLLVARHALVLGDVAQILHGILYADTVEVVYLAARKNRRDNLVLLGRGEDEDSVLWRLLEGFEECVEGGRREHMHLVDDKDRVVPHLWNDAHLLYEVADVVNRVVRGGIQLVDVERAPLVE